MMSEQQLWDFKACYEQAEAFIENVHRNEASKQHERTLEIIQLAKVFYDISKQEDK